MNRSIGSLFFSLSFLFLIVPGARAQWMLDGVPVGTAANTQDEASIIPDGSGGAVVAWRDARSGSIDIYVQRIDASGTALWTPNGVALCVAAGTQDDPVIVSDGTGGAIVAWADYRTGATSDIYAQRVNSSGVPQWTANGVALCTAASNQAAPQIVADGLGGAIVTWYDYRSGPTSDIYVQRVSASGVPQWTANGVALCTAVENQLSPVITTDGSGGAIVAWYDLRGAANYDIYVRGVNFLGSPVWTANGVALCTAAGGQTFPAIVSDGSGGAVVVWEDYRGGATADVYARRVSVAGAAQWTADGVALCTAVNDQLAPAIVSDGSFGAIVAWRDARSGSGYDIYARRVNASGVPQWTGNGVALCTAALNQFFFSIVADGSGGAIVAWDDSRSGDLDIYARPVNAAGVPQWTADGVAVCTAAINQTQPGIVLDGMGGAIVAWEDGRTGAGNDIYAQRLEGRYGYWGHPEPVITSVADIPGDQGGKVKVNWTASGWDVLNFRTITHYSIWRATEAAPLPAGAGMNVMDDPSRIGPDFAGQAYYVQPSPSGDYYFEWVGNQDAMYLPAYTFSAATRADSTSQGTAPHYFLVFSHTADAFTFWPSNVDSGYSVDNLAPAAPLMLTAQRVGADVHLRWNRVTIPDLRDYSVYRATSPGVTPVPVNFLAGAEDTVLIDASAPTSALYYIVTAYDVHENQSDPSNEASVSALTGVGGTPPIPALMVLQNQPNPFAGMTELQIGLPSESDLAIEVYSVSGARVRTQALARRGAGWQRVPFDGRDDAGRLLPSGVYFYRVTAAGKTVARKMVIAR